MNQSPAPNPNRMLVTQLRWFIRLRWIAAAAVLGGTLANLRWLHWFAWEKEMLGLGCAIAGYNAILWLVLTAWSRRPGQRRFLALTMAQILLDLACLTLLTLWSGNTFSPLLGFYVFHMVIASLLLPRTTAYGAAAAAVIMLIGALWTTHQLPERGEVRLILGGWIVTLLLTVYLANRITMALRRQRRRLAHKNLRIRSMMSRLRRQQDARVQQEKMAALGQMAASVAHEVTNPLASMDGLLQVLERHPEQGRGDAIATLRQLVSRIGRIVRQVTTFAHPSQAEWQMVELSEVVERALEMVQLDPRLPATPIIRQYDPEGCRAWAQPLALQQVVVNLLINALDAMENQPSPHLTLVTANREDARLLQIRDNGVGVAKADLDRIFEPFFTTKQIGKGTGLGLSISYSLVRTQGGRIKVDSEPGKGATFTVHLQPAPPTMVPVSGKNA